MKHTAFSMAALAALLASPALAEPSVEHGEYLATVMLCADCHTPPTETGPDMTRAYTGGLGFEVGGLGIFWAPNLTPDATGLGGWTTEQIVAAIREGQRPDGRELAPIMPWKFFAKLTDDDATSLALYLQSLEPVANTVPAPVGPGETPPAPYLTMVEPGAPRS